MIIVDSKAFNQAKEKKSTCQPFYVFSALSAVT